MPVLVEALKSAEAGFGARDIRFGGADFHAECRITFTPLGESINLYDGFGFFIPTKKARARTNGAATFRLPLSHRCGAALAERENASSASPKQFLIMFGWNANKCLSGPSYSRLVGHWNELATAQCNY